VPRNRAPARRSTHGRCTQGGQQDCHHHLVQVTVDSAQGSEADIVILSLVRSNATNNIGHARDRRRINVALSRAKHRLIVVGNADCFQMDKVWRDLSKIARKER